MVFSRRMPVREKHGARILSSWLICCAAAQSPRGSEFAASSHISSTEL